ncbi:MAG: ABC transporter permease [Anaerosomatales bacterium]|nr:ABC transporter permease [Anaerosomatales bacterium]MDT8433631.1 ABC transporter permease [Anaerosomatales bacterium]
MSRTVSRGEILGALLKKELIAYSRDKLYLFLTLLTLVFVVGIFWVVPDSVEESITLGVTPPVQTLVDDGIETLRALGATDEQLAELREADLAEGEEGFSVVEFESAEQMAAVIEGTLQAWRTDEGELVLRDREAGEARPADAERVPVDIGIAFPPSFIGDVATGAEGVSVTVYSDAAVPEEIQGAMTSFVREMAYEFAGRELPVEMPDEETIVLGTDRAGDQVSMREKLIPMLAFMMLLIETFAMASLISVEVLQRTVTAVLVTPARVIDFLTAKSIFGTGLALSQGLIVLALIGAFTAQNWWLLLITMLLGAMMFTGVAMIVGAAGKDFMGQLFYAMLFTVPLLIPAFSVLFPGSAAAWVRVLPTFPLLDALVNITIYEAVWADVWRSFALGAAWLVVLFGAGLVILKRKVESL